MFEQPLIPAVDVVEAKRLVDDERALLIDCRELNEWNEARIPGAEFKPMSAVTDWYRDLPVDRTVILQCRTGDRSGQITHALVTQVGMTNVFNMSGGIVAWHQAGLPVETG